VIGIHIDESDIAGSHLDYFNAVTSYVKNVYGILIDQSCKDLARACFLPYDSEAHLNLSAKPLTRDFIES